MIDGRGAPFWKDRRLSCPVIGQGQPLDTDGTLAPRVIAFQPCIVGRSGVGVVIPEHTSQIALQLELESGQLSLGALNLTDGCSDPALVAVEAGDFAQGLVSAAMGVAREVVQRLEFAEDGDVDGGPERKFQFV